MIAQVQKLLVCAGLAALGGWIWLSAEYLHPAWMLVGVLGVPLAHVGVLGFEFAQMYRVNRHDLRHPVSAQSVAVAWLAETLISARVFYWDQPFRSRAVKDRLTSRPGQRAVVLIHGFVCNRGFWNTWTRRLRALGIPYLAISLEPIFGTIDDASDAIDAAVRRATQATGLSPVIVTHSMGGLSVRAWLRAHSADDRVHHIISIAAPHQGTDLAQYASSDTTKRMRIGSPWLTALAASEPRSRYRLFTCYYGHCDNIVFPTNSATLPGADNRHVAGQAHIQMALCTEVFQEAVRKAAPMSAAT